MKENAEAFPFYLDKSDLLDLNGIDLPCSYCQRSSTTFDFVKNMLLSALDSIC